MSVDAPAISSPWQNAVLEKTKINVKTRNSKKIGSTRNCAVRFIVLDFGLNKAVKIKGHLGIANRETAVFTYGNYGLSLRYISYWRHSSSVLHLFLYLSKVKATKSLVKLNPVHENQCSSPSLPGYLFIVWRAGSCLFAGYQ